MALQYVYCRSNSNALRTANAGQGTCTNNPANSYNSLMPFIVNHGPIFIYEHSSTHNIKKNIYI